ncbi:Splicing factor-like protein 1, partial [Mucuna pruriens]
MLALYSLAHAKAIQFNSDIRFIASLNTQVPLSFSLSAIYIPIPFSSFILQFILQSTVSECLDKRMSAEIDSSSAPEPHKMSGASSAATTSGQKLSMFAAKSGFVIPKNKLSGSLVPIFRGAKKHGVTGAINEESSKQTERRSKWGPDRTQDATVRRGKALALQIRVDQITKQLESEKLELGDTQNLPLKSEMLELEKREAIGEILKLDPSYKPPRGFKPLLKEANIPLPVQEYPGYNFVGLIYGPEGDNQKRLEKETGTKIKIHGTKADTGEKGEIKPGTDIQCSYKDMHVNISADSFDKVDAAMSIIELLITSVTGNLAAGSTPSISVSRDSTNVLSQSQEGPPSHADSLSLENQAVLQPVAVTQMHGDNFQYTSPWFSVVPSHTPVFASSGSVAPPNPIGHARTPHFPSQTSNTALSFGAQPVPVTGFQPITPNLHVSVQAPPPRQILQYSHMTQTSPLGHIGPPRNPSIISVHNLSIPTNASLSFPVTLSQSTPIGQLQTSVSSMHLPLSGISPSPLPLPNQPLTQLGVSSSGQNEAPVPVKMSIGPTNMGPMAPPARPVSLHQQPDVAFKPPQSNMSMMPRSATFPPHQVGISPGPSSSLRPMPGPTHSSVNHLSGPVSFPSPGISPSLPLPQQAGVPNSASGVAPYHTHVKPPVLMTSKSGNFTFQSHPPNADYSQAGATQEPPSGPRPLPFGFAVPDQPLQIFPRTQFLGQVDQAVPFGGRSGSISNSIPPPRHAAFPYGQPAPRSPVPQMGMKNFISAPQRPNLTSAGAQRGMPIRQSYPAQMARPDIPMPLNHNFVNNPPMASGKLPYPADQIYDPFSPTSAPKGNPGK